MNPFFLVGLILSTVPGLGAWQQALSDRKGTSRPKFKDVVLYTFAGLLFTWVVVLFYYFAIGVPNKIYAEAGSGRAVPPPPAVAPEFAYVSQKKAARTTASIVVKKESWSSARSYLWKHNLDTLIPSSSCFGAEGQAMLISVSVIDRDTVMLAEAIPETTKCYVRK